jgi:formate hydrogenlyase transcriptional activator
MSAEAAMIKFVDNPTQPSVFAIPPLPPIAPMRDANADTVSLCSSPADDRLRDDIVGRSAALRKVLADVEMVAPTEAAVLICGETGTGKELLARAVHTASPRRGRALVTCNCAAIPAALLESELFGHDKGAFTGAMMQRVGRFELADRGTMFLDEIGEAPLEIQPKLLRVLQEREFERLGSSRTIRTDARIVAATNADLGAMVQAKSFRADLYYRLNVFPISVPPLRERRDDILPLVRHFARTYAARMGRSMTHMSARTMSALLDYSWPGNIRELQNVVQRAVIRSTGARLEVATSDIGDRAVVPIGQPTTLDEVQRAHILATLKATGWVLAGPRGAAVRLGLNRNTLQFRMKKLGIVRLRAS